MLTILIRFILPFCMILTAHLVSAQDVAEELYSRYESSVYRVEVVTPGVENKASVGTGFVSGRNDILASNYHVISNVVNEQDAYQLEREGVAARLGYLSVMAVGYVDGVCLI